ncbi:MAG: radical SAM protein [Polyangiaceae bacterium]
MVDILFHGADCTVTVALPEGAPSGASPLLTLGDTALDLETGTVRLGPFAAIALQRRPPAASLEAWNELVACGRKLSGIAFRDGLTDSAPLPSHLYVTVTERCNIACAHCITFAPEKTAEGRARTVQPWLIDALREPFAAAEYVAFVHGGESLVAPAFWDILRAIESTRARRPGRVDIHLLSNGMLLDETRVRRLIDGGLTSLSVSLDGATEPTNDSLRKGGKLPTILANLRRAADLRRELSADLRIGVSTVVTAGNFEELPKLGTIVAEMGLDWLKVEEIFPCTPTARHLNIPGRDPRVEQAMNELYRTLARTNVVIVDHRDPPSGCPCDARDNPLLAEFRKADDFANRTEMRPCRMEWEQACIDPDGAVHPVHYGEPPIGNLLTASLAELWNGPDIAARRRAALRRTRKDLRKTCPHL